MTKTKTKTGVALILAAALTVSSVGLMLWGSALRKAPEDPPARTEPPVTTEATVPPETTEATEPPPPTPAEIVESYATAHGYTLADYPEKLIELLGRNPQAEQFVLEYPMEYGKEHEIEDS